MLKPAEIAEFRNLLMSLKARLRGDVEQLSDEALERGNNGGESPTHLAELGTASFEQDFSLHLMENDQEVLKEITAAIGRIENGTYGLCEGCLAEGRPASKALIPKLRLKAIPYARDCVNCKRKREEMSL
jgi:DnaK suppressor protein